MKAVNGKALAVAVGVCGALVISVRAGAVVAPGNPTVVTDTQAASDAYGTALPNPFQPNTLIEPSIAVNPGDPNNVVTVFQVGRVDAGGDADNGFGTTLNARAAAPTWTHGNLPGLTATAPNPVLTTGLCPSAPTTPAAFDRASDAVVTFGLDPTGQAHGGYFAYAQSLVFDSGNTCSALPSGMAINVSSDGGVTWGPALIVEHDAGGGLNDKNWIVTDNQTGIGHHPGRTYIVWDRVASVEVAYCDPDSPASIANGTGCDKITNWSSVGGNAFFPLFPGQAIGTIPIVLNNGSLGVIYNSLTSACTPSEGTGCVNTVGGSNINWGVIPGMGAAVFPSPPASSTFVPFPIASYQSNGVQYQRAGSLPSMAYDPVTGGVLVGWEDNRYRTDAAGAPGNQNDLVVSYGAPVGGPQGAPAATWSTPQKVNTDAPNSNIDHWNAMVAVGNDGIWRVGYRQRYEPLNFSATSGPIDTYYQESRDLGTSFTAPLKVNTAVATDPQFGAFSRNGLFLGDYQQLVAGAGNDETFVTREEAFAPTAGASCTTSFVNIPATPCQNQTDFVAYLAPLGAPLNTPESPLVPGLLLFGAAVGAVAWRRHRAGLTAVD